MAASRETQQQLADMAKDARVEVQRLRKACMDFADEHGLTFKWDDTYGSREQTYHGKGAPFIDSYGWEASDADDVLDQGKWTSSSEGC